MLSLKRGNGVIGDLTEDEATCSVPMVRSRALRVSNVDKMEMLNRPAAKHHGEANNRISPQRLTERVLV